MPQTILSIAAVILFSLFAVSQQQRLVYTEQAMIRNTIGTITNGVAQATIDEIAASPFDVATKTDPVDDADDLTPKANFGLDGKPDDVDDWSKIDLNPPQAIASATRDLVVEDTTYTLTFTRIVEVNYVSKNVSGEWEESANPTAYKRIELTVYSDQIDVADTVRIKHVVACGSRCRFN